MARWRQTGRTLTAAWAVIAGTSFFIDGWARLWQSHLSAGFAAWPSRWFDAAFQNFSAGRAIGLGLFWLIAINLYLYQKSRFPVWLLLGAGMGALLLGNRTAGWAGLVLLGCLAAEYLASRPHGGLPGLQ